MEKMNLYQKLVEVRRSVKYIQKGAQGFNFKYATEGHILAAIRGKMDEMNVFLEVDMKSLEPVECSIVHTTSDKQKLVTKIPGLRAVLEFRWTNADDPEDFLVKQLIVQDAESVIKTVGSLMTYANKFFLYKFFSVPTDNLDPDAFENNLNRMLSSDDDQEDPKFLNEKQIQTIKDLIGDDKDFQDRMLTYYSIKSFNELKADLFGEIVKYANKHNESRIKKEMEKK